MSPALSTGYVRVNGKYTCTCILPLMAESVKGAVRTSFEKTVHFTEIIKRFPKRELKDCEKLPI